MAARKVFRTLVSVEEAQQTFKQHYDVQPLGVEEVKVAEAYGRVLAEDIVARFDVPGFDRATMDGYAVRAQDIFGAEEDNPIALKPVGTIEPGQKPSMEIGEKETAEIATGAPIPKGANAVAMVEYTSKANGFIEIYRSVVPGENIMAAGSDIMTGELVLKTGRRLTAREMGVASALGLAAVKVYRRPKVAILSTGNEILSAGSKLQYGKIFDINAASISGAVSEAGALPMLMGVARDDEEKMKTSLKRALSSCDMVLSSGSTSAGAGDMMYRVIDELGAPGVLVHGLTLKPGKPTVIAVVGGKPVIALPGYPTSALMIFNVVVQPVLRAMSGLPYAASRTVIEARAAYRVFAGKGRRELLPVHLVADSEGKYLVYPVEGGGSGAITSMAVADGFIDVAESREFVEEGESVNVHLFSEELRLADLVVIGSHCIGLDMLAKLIKRKHQTFDMKIVNVGSMGGLRAVGRGEADVAGTHLVDEHGAFNKPYLEKLEIADRVTLVRGYNREQGLIFGKGNPKNVKKLEDLLRNDVTMINRNPGSGTRILLDIKLKELSPKLGLSFEETKKKIKGYSSEAKSHTAVAAAIAQGRADVGVGIRTVAEFYGLGFIHLADEHYDFAIPGNRLEKPSVKILLEALRHPEFAKSLEKEAPGLVTTRETGSIIA
ncbi:MAG: molybdopterin biosynthesis protein [Thaumarchaeota archaeon]|nr:molybdopterin biosynthesis protein [Nitrososphaerota archaeon]